MVILKSLVLNRDKKTLQENYKPEFQLFIEKLNLYIQKYILSLKEKSF